WQDSNGRSVPFVASRADVAKVLRVTGTHGFLYLTWAFLATGTLQPQQITTSEVASGRLDGYIRDYAIAIRNYGAPVLIRLFGGEFNGNWWASVSPRANPDLTTTDFVEAWRRVVDIFNEVGAENVSWAWVPQAASPTDTSSVDPNLDAYYPGDAYVDWVGADIYDNQNVVDLDQSYRFSVTHGKPFMVGEWGVRHTNSTLPPTHA